MIDIFIKGGFLMYPILFCSISGLAIIINKSIQYRGILKEIDRPFNDIMKNVPAMLAPILEALKRSEEHTSELQSHSFISYAVFCLKKKTIK